MNLFTVRNYMIAIKDTFEINLILNFYLQKISFKHINNYVYKIGFCMRVKCFIILKN